MLEDGTMHHGTNANQLWDIAQDKFVADYYFTGFGLSIIIAKKVILSLFLAAKSFFAVNSQQSTSGS